MKKEYKEMPAFPMNPVGPTIRLAQAYIPEQPYVALYPLDEALMKGTIFPNLYMPYKEKHKGKHRGEE